MRMMMMMMMTLVFDKINIKVKAMICMYFLMADGCDDCDIGK